MLLLEYAEAQDLNGGIIGMATIIECPVCRGKVASDATSCVHCGHPLCGSKINESLLKNEKQSVCKIQLISSNPQTTHFIIRSDYKGNVLKWIVPKNSDITIDVPGKIHALIQAVSQPVDSKIPIVNCFAELSRLEPGHNYEVRHYRDAKLGWRIRVHEIK